MTAQIVGFVTRADAKMRPPRSVSRKITPDRGGAAAHYGGPAQKLRTHADCVARWRAWQAFHMDTHGWVDIAYTGGYCDHGYGFAGRGLGIRTAANGTNAGNQSYYAFVWLGGDGEVPTAKALDALRWWVLQARQHDAGQRVQPHHTFTGTRCPGGHLTTAAAQLDNKPIPTPTPTDVQEDDMAKLVTVDGHSVYSVTAHAVEHVPNPTALATLRRHKLVPKTAPERITQPEFDALRAATSGRTA